LPRSIDVSDIEDAQMKIFKLVLIVALLIGYAPLAHAGIDDGKAAKITGRP
jgi:hypothetical protein